MGSSVQRSHRKLGNFLLIVLFLQLTTYVIVFLDIPILRQVAGFLYLTFIPGVVILRMLKLNELDLIEKILFSAGLSITFLMLTGLLINEIGTLAGIAGPLSTLPLMIILNTVILLLCFPRHVRDTELSFSATENSKFSPMALLFIALPLLSIAGAVWVNAVGNNFILLLMLVIISGLVVMIFLSERLVPSKYYPLAVLMIAISLLFHASLISNYIYGHDIHFEYYAFKSTQNDSHWNSAISYTNLPAYTSFNAMLSITVLPTIYSNILGLEATWIFKIVYPLIFSFVPLGLYQLFKTQVGKKIAFASSLFFMANAAFFSELLSLNRQMIAELFFVLLFLVLLNKKMNIFNRRMCFIVFSFALIVSHYSTAYVFMFLIFFAWLLSFLRKNGTQSITASSVALFFIIAFSWYIYTSGSGPFNGLLSAGEHISTSLLTEFFNLGSRGELVLRGLGMEAAPSFWHMMGRVFAYVTEFFILFGFITHVIKRKKGVFDRDYVLMSWLNIGLLLMNLIIPSFASSINMSRFYHLELFILAPFCILGGEAFFRSILNRIQVKKQLSTAFLLMVIIIFFFFQTGFIYEVTADDSWSVSLSGYRMDNTRKRLLGVPYRQDVFGAEWLSRNVNFQDAFIYADAGYTHFELASYGMINIEKTVSMISNTTITELINGTLKGTVYLGQTNVVDGIFNVYGGQDRTWNTSEISSFLNNMNIIYSNGASEIYAKLESVETGSQP